MVKSPGRCSHCCGRVTLQGKVIWARAREKGYHLTFYLHFYLSDVAPLLVQSSSATLANLSRPHLWSSHLAGARERQAFDHRCGRVAKLALERRRVQQRCPRAPTPEPGKGRRPKNQQSQRGKVFLPGCSVFSLSWPACAWSLLVPVRWFSGPAPSGFSLFWFRLMFLSIGRGRRVPAPGGRDVGSSAVAPTQEPAQAPEFQRLVHPSRQFIPSSCVSSFAVVPNHTASVPVFTRKLEDSFLAQ